MAITQKQKQERQKHIGSSDMPAILGLDRFRTAYDVWLEKTGKIESAEPTEAMQAGTLFEPGILKFAEQKLGSLEKRPNVLWFVFNGSPLASNVDAIVKHSGEPVEAKTAGLFGPLVDTWGEPETDDIPDAVCIQCHVHMLCTNVPLCHIAAFLGGRGFNLYHISEDKELRNIVIERATKFWQDHVTKDIPPADSVPSLELIKKIRRQPESITTIDNQLVENWRLSKDAVKVAESAKDQAEARLIAALGTAEAGQSEQGLITFYEQIRKEYTRTVPECRYRVLRFKKGG